MVQSYSHVIVFNEGTGNLWENVYVHHGLYALVQAVVKANSQSNGKGQILTPLGLQKPWTDFDETLNI